MAGVKFSAFTTGATTANTLIVGYDSVAGTNNQYTLAQLATGLGITTIYDGDGTLSAARTLSMDGNNLTFSGGTGVYPTLNIGDITLYPNGQNSSAYPSKNSMQVPGLIRFPYYGAASPGLSWASYNTAVKAYGFSMYGGGGWTHNSGYSVIGPDFLWNSGDDLTARLGVIGVHNDNTSYAFRVQNSDLTDIFSVNNDTTTTVEKNLVVKGQGYTEQHDSLAGNATVDWDNGNVQYIQLASGANTFTPSNPKDGATYILQIKQPSSGAAGTITWGASVKWPAATAPTLTATNDYIDIVTLIYNGTTTHYYAAATLDLR
jgi:hypothetical protein